MYQEPSTQVSPAGCTLALLKKPKATERETALSRFVFDDLFELDLLGFLLSSHHFKAHLTRMELRSPPKVALGIREILRDELNLLAFHNLMLAMYSGVYIEECKCKTRTELMDVLDDKYRSATGDEDAFQEVEPDDSNKVEAAWLYRGVCNSGSPILQMQGCF